jgi:hypothetical protein
MYLVLALHLRHTSTAKSFPEKRPYRQLEIPAISSVREGDLFFSELEGVARSNPEQLDIEQSSGGVSSGKVKADYYSQFCYSEVIT